MGGIDGTSSQHLQILMTTVAETLGVARRQKEEHEEWRWEETHDVLGQHGHHDSFRCGKTDTHRENVGVNNISRGG